MTVREITLTLVDGVKIVVPDDLALITPYVLQEQGDWFEDEIRFVRAWGGPGLRALDIGANYGVYTLAMALRAGPSGRVWAVEPGGDVLACLARSLDANGFGNVEVLPCALSRYDGHGTLDGAASPELRRLGPQAASGGQTVEVRTLDGLAAERGIERVDFVKIDAEGEEVNVLDGGAAFFTRESPLLMLEVKNGDEINDAIFAPLAALGYCCYRLVPGLNVLVPFSEAEEPEPFQLNVFAAKTERAAALNASGWLALGETHERALPDVRFAHRLCARPFAQELAACWRQWFAAQTGHDDYVLALAGYFTACEPSARPDVRVAALEDAYRRLGALARAQPTIAHLASFCRVASALGWRAEAVAACGQLLRGLLQSPPEAPLATPCLPPAAAHDTIPVQGDGARWLLWAAIEALECARTFSGYYAGALIADDLKLTPDPRFVSPAFLRRAALARRRAGAYAGDMMRR